MYWKVSSICSTRTRVKWWKNWNWKLEKRSTHMITWAKRPWKFYSVSSTLCSPPHPLAVYHFSFASRFFRSRFKHFLCAARCRWWVKINATNEIIMSKKRKEKNKRNNRRAQLNYFAWCAFMRSPWHKRAYATTGKVSSNYACATFKWLFFSHKLFPYETFYCDAFFFARSQLLCA